MLEAAVCQCRLPSFFHHPIIKSCPGHKRTPRHWAHSLTRCSLLGTAAEMWLLFADERCLEYPRTRTFRDVMQGSSPRTTAHNCGRRNALWQAASGFISGNRGKPEKRWLDLFERRLRTHYSTRGPLDAAMADGGVSGLVAWPVGGGILVRSGSIKQLNPGATLACHLRPHLHWASRTTAHTAPIPGQRRLCMSCLGFWKSARGLWAKACRAPVLRPFVAANHRRAQIYRWQPSRDYPEHREVAIRARQLRTGTAKPS
jgi:hypothetical protein